VKCEAANMQKWQGMKCQIKRQKLISISNAPLKTDVEYNLNEMLNQSVTNAAFVSAAKYFCILYIICVRSFILYDAPFWRQALTITGYFFIF